MVRVFGTRVRQGRSWDVSNEWFHLDAILTPTEFVRHGLDASGQLLRLSSQTIRTLFQHQTSSLYSGDVVPLTIELKLVFVQLAVDVRVVLLVQLVQLVEPL